MDIKHEVEKNLSKLSTLRDEIRLQLHLASLDAKKEWEENLEPKVLEAEGAAKHASEASMTVVHDAIERLERFARRLAGA